MKPLHAVRSNAHLPADCQVTHAWAMQHPTEDDAWNTRGRLIAATLGLGGFLANFDVTSVVVIMPAIGTDLGIRVDGLAWIIDAYSLAFTGTLLVAGALADRFGRQRTLILGNACFLAASFACALAWNGPLFLAARAAQGYGAAFLVTGTFASIATAFPAPGVRARAFGIVGVVSGVAMALGPSLGGVIGSGLGWRWIFLANLPFCALIALAVPRLVTEARDGVGRPLDWPGVVTLTLALGLMIESILEARHSLIRMTPGARGGRRTCRVVRRPAAATAASHARSGRLREPNDGRRRYPAAGRLGGLLVGPRLPSSVPGCRLRLDSRGDRVGATGRDPPHGRYPSLRRSPRLPAGMAAAVRFGADADLDRWMRSRRGGADGTSGAGPCLDLCRDDADRRGSRAIAPATLRGRAGARATGVQRHGIGRHRHRAAGWLRDGRRRARRPHALRPWCGWLCLALRLCRSGIGVLGAGLPSASGVIKEGLSLGRQGSRAMSA